MAEIGYFFSLGWAKQSVDRARNLDSGRLASKPRECVFSNGKDTWKVFMVVVVGTGLEAKTKIWNVRRKKEGVSGEEKECANQKLRKNQGPARKWSQKQRAYEERITCREADARGWELGETLWASSESCSDWPEPWTFQQQSWPCFGLCHTLILILIACYLAQWSCEFMHLLMFPVPHL